MIYRDPRCVFVSDSIGQCDVVAVWLGHQGIPAQVMNQATMGGLLGLTPFSRSGVSQQGIEVWAEDEAQAEQARQLLANHQEFQNATKQTDEEEYEILAACESCGEDSLFSSRYRGTVQDCPHCGSYMDVPGDDDEHEWDVGEAEE